ncbi:D-alanyl-D-alanine carboxypeptidase [Staphylococcus piscifermentans]|uniref:D-Ala-D-Ala carboxypeptidase n=1 Tax=Staphylococcus piscifermentans TaxID=70258 RepID=A0A239TUC7_9STAP|nr:M15 family metallopeptidase [Staphylococcus piscifermentans]RTX82984.1 D-alanyl-D-alanine carboxypeptidase family protein [Staphylococcus piscifermentans]GEP84924.1 D-Ala-D-Ala carboxypeptidase [Staphylococcus piscifermentans]SNV00738.1 D-alanyl-D-alanine carboxypeptidase [Staphylococcus piscifermentans]
MKKYLGVILAATVTLTACGEKSEGEKTSKKESAIHTEQISKQKHQIKKENGVTKIDNLILVNKKVPISKSYNKGEDAVARTQLNKMIEDGRKHGLNILYRSGFRSYAEQTQLYNSYVQRDGKAAADKYSAAPGTSEHQTGLAFDVGTNPSNADFKEAFGQTREGKWLADNAYKYGFILRYPKGKEKITGYQYEPWHFRYVGKKDAKKIHAQKLTLEEYLDYGYKK